MLSAVTVSYPRRQQLRRLMRAARLAARRDDRVGRRGAAGAAPATPGLALLARGGRGRDGATESSRAAPGRRSRVGAESEAQVRRALEPLAREGWHVAHAVDWPGRGDLDHVLRSPSGMGFVIETKTLRYSRAHVVRTIDAARWLARKRRRYPRGVMPVVCVARARRLEVYAGRRADHVARPPARHASRDRRRSTAWPASRGGAAAGERGPRWEAPLQRSAKPAR